MNKNEAMELFEKNNNIKIEDFTIDRRLSREEKLKFDQYIGREDFSKNIEVWLDNFEEKEIVLNLLANYSYVPECAYGANLDDMLNQIIEKCGSNDTILENTYFITFPSSKGVKSGGDIIRAELPLGHLDTITKSQLISNFEKNIPKIKKSAKCIVFIDDVIGTGKTALTNIEKMLKDLGDIKDIRIFLAAMYAEESTIKKIINKLKKEGYEIEYVLLKKQEKCMKKDYIFKDIYKYSTDVITKYEEITAGKGVKDEGSYAMGYKNTQFLLSFYYNTPNNTLCIFWKPTKTNFPLFLRSSFKRPSVNDIVEERKKRKENAYETAKLSRIKR